MAAQEAPVPKSWWATVLGTIEHNLQSIFKSIWGITKNESETTASLTATGTGILASGLSFYEQHPTITKAAGLFASSVVIARGQQYLSIKGALDEARVFCREVLPRIVEPEQNGRLTYNPNVTYNAAEKAIMIQKCNELIGKLSSSSYLRSWLEQLNATNVNMNLINMDDENDIVQAIINNHVAFEQYIAAIGCPQYYAWSEAPSVWYGRCAAVNRNNCLLSAATAVYTPYDGEATRLVCRLYIIKDELNGNLNQGMRVARAAYYPAR
jgi:hypothetical protein